MSLSAQDVPALAPGFRFQWEPAQQAHVLLYPEGMVKLSDTAAEILQRVDGVAAVGEIISMLERAYPGADLRADVMEFLDAAYQRRWVTAQGR